MVIVYWHERDLGTGYWVENLQNLTQLNSTTPYEKTANWYIKISIGLKLSYLHGQRFGMVWKIDFAPMGN